MVGEKKEKDDLKLNAGDYGWIIPSDPNKSLWLVIRNIEEPGHCDATVHIFNPALGHDEVVVAPQSYKEIELTHLQSDGLFITNARMGLATYAPRIECQLMVVAKL